MLTGDLFRLVAYGILLCVGATMWIRRPAQRGLTTFGVLFAIYAVEVASVTIFPIPVDGHMAADMQRAGVSFWSRLTLDPVPDDFGSRQVLLNVTLGMPFGFGAWFVLKQPSVRKVLLSGAAFFLGIELVQLTISALVGFMYRVVDASDLVANFLGVLVGTAVFLLFVHGFRAIDQDNRLGEGMVWTHIRQTANGNRTVSLNTVQTVDRS